MRILFFKFIFPFTLVLTVFVLFLLRLINPEFTIGCFFSYTIIYIFKDYFSSKND